MSTERIADLSQDGGCFEIWDLLHNCMRNSRTALPSWNSRDRSDPLSDPSSW
jgi:hypothetical protein